MHPCPWRDNPLRRLPAEVVKGKLRLAVNSELAVPFSHLGADLLVPARCRLCLFLFEGECAYPPTAGPPAERTPKLAAWAVGIGESPVAAADAASIELKAWLGATVPANVAIVLTCSDSAALSEVNEALEKALEGLPEEVSFSLSVELSENPGSLVLLCAWAAC
jgi:hypothetical protein